MLIGYSVRHSHELNDVDVSLLIDLGFAFAAQHANPSVVADPCPPQAKASSVGFSPPAAKVAPAPGSADRSLRFSPTLAQVDPARSRSPKPVPNKVSRGHLGEYVLIELHGRTADLHRATLKAGLRHILCNPPSMFVPGVRGLPLDLGNDAEGVVQLLDAEKARVALMWCELPPQPCSSFAANLCTVCEFAFDRQIPLAIAGSPKSEFWRDPLLHTLIANLNLQSHLCHLCCHGDGRPRPYQFTTSQTGWAALGLTCKSGHKHAPWVPRRQGDPPWDCQNSCARESCHL